jgi:hypothetical protein
VRASDAEREEYAATVRESVADGRLSMEEGEERQTKVYTARFRDELPPLVADLPGPGVLGRLGGGFGGPFGPGGPRRGPFGPGAAGPGQAGDADGSDPDTVRRWARLAFARHLTFFLVVGAILVSVWALTGAHFFWPLIPLVVLGIGLARHGAWLRWAGAPGGAPWGYRRGWGPAGRC